MTLKLIDRELRSKYAEALYKNESSFEKLMDRRIKRLTLDYTRASDVIEAGSLVFLNQVKQKRSKWIQDDLKYRDYYRIVCRKVHNNKLENLKQSIGSANVRSMSQDTKIKFNLLQQQLYLKNMKMTFYKSEKQLDQILDKTEAVTMIKKSANDIFYNENQKSRVPKLPNLKNSIVKPQTPQPDIHIKELYSRYTLSDRGFLDKFPGKVELTVTDIGRQYIFNTKNKNQILKVQDQSFKKIQSNALHDKRFENLVSYLEE